VSLFSLLQYVTTDHYFSPICDIIGGVPQSSILDCILFFIYINDMTLSSAATTLFNYYNDTTLYPQVKMKSSSVSLQQTLHYLTYWANDWQLTINTYKRLVLSISTKSIPKQLKYYINGIPVFRRNSSVDLGVTISDDFLFGSRVDNVMSKALQRLNLLFLGLLTQNVSVMHQAFIAYIRI
jgi:hypothetical protein